MEDREKTSGEEVILEGTRPPVKGCIIRLLGKGVKNWTRKWPADGRVVFVDTGSIHLVVGKETCTQLGGTNPDSGDGHWSTQEIEGILQKKLGEKGKRVDTLFKKDYWILYEPYQVLDRYTKPFVDLTPSCKKKVESEYYLVKNCLCRKEVCFKVAKETPVDSENALLCEGGDEEFETFTNYTSNLPPEALVSTIRTIVRTQGMVVNFYDRSIDSVKVLSMAVNKLLKSPYNFGYVLKSLAIMGIEDTFLKESDLFKLLGLAFLSHKTGWRPGQETASWVLELAEGMANSKFYYDIDSDVRNPFHYKASQSKFKNASALLDEMGAPDSSLNILRAVASKPEVLESINMRPSEINIGDIVNHHWEPNIALLTHHEYECVGPKPYEMFFKEYFESGEKNTNPRRTLRIGGLCELTKRVRARSLIFLNYARERVGEATEGHFFAIHEMGGGERHEMSFELGTHIPYESDKHCIPNYVDVEWRTSLRKLLSGAESRVIFRVLMYLDGTDNVVNVHRIAEDGGSETYQVTMTDQKANEFLLKLGHIFPPALRPLDYAIGRFVSDAPHLLWRIRDHIWKFQNKRKTQKWLMGENVGGSEITPCHQRALDHIKRLNTRGHLVWSNRGTEEEKDGGITLVSLSYIRWLDQQSLLPTHVIYMCDNSSVASVVEEANCLGIRVNILVSGEKTNKTPVFDGNKASIKTTSDTIDQNTITLVVERTRKLYDKLLEVAEGSLLVVDGLVTDTEESGESGEIGISQNLATLASRFLVLAYEDVYHILTDKRHSKKFDWWLKNTVTSPCK